jgi:hypothetical protein
MRSSGTASFAGSTFSTPAYSVRCCRQRRGCACRPSTGRGLSKRLPPSVHSRIAAHTLAHFCARPRLASALHSPCPSTTGMQASCPADEWQARYDSGSLRRKKKRTSRDNHPDSPNWLDGSVQILGLCCVRYNYTHGCTPLGLHMFQALGDHFPGSPFCLALTMLRFVGAAAFLRT